MYILGPLKRDSEYHVTIIGLILTVTYLKKALIHSYS